MPASPAPRRALPRPDHAPIYPPRPCRRPYTTTDHALQAWFAACPCTQPSRPRSHHLPEIPHTPWSLSCNGCYLRGHAHSLPRQTISLSGSCLVLACLHTVVCSSRYFDFVLSPSVLPFPLSHHLRSALVCLRRSRPSRGADAPTQTDLSLRPPPSLPDCGHVYCRTRAPAPSILPMLARPLPPKRVTRYRLTYVAPHRAHSIPPR